MNMLMNMLMNMHSVTAVPRRRWNLRNQSLQPFHFLQCESKVFVHKSNINGLGLYAKQKILKNRVVCLYTGKCLKHVHGNFSYYLLSTKWKNQVTGEYEIWYLDSCEKRNASGRYINDACDYEGVPEQFCTKFKNNVRLGHTHLVIKCMKLWVCTSPK